MDRDEPRFVNPGESRLRLEIKMLLSTNSELPFDSKSARIDGRRVSVADSQRLVEETAGLDGLLDRQDTGSGRTPSHVAAPASAASSVSQAPREV